MRDPLLTPKESRAIARLSERACGDLGCATTQCEDIRLTLVAVRRLLARLAVVRKAAHGELKGSTNDDTD